MANKFKQIVSSDKDMRSICVFDRKGKFLGYINLNKNIKKELQLKGSVAVNLLASPAEIAVFSVYKNGKFDILTYVTEGLQESMKRPVEKLTAIYAEIEAKDAKEAENRVE